ncbi:MAG: hypothetical protein GC154_10780 [bacterium]|nr:hypothetical protein [bacterium]
MKIYNRLCAVMIGVALTASASAWGARGEIRFDHPLQEWDGFGVNYVETAQTRDYDEWPQDYGGLSTLSESDKQAVIDLIFGDDGLKPGVVKQFIDPFHEGMTEADNDNDDPTVINLDGYTHTRTTENMRYFIREGLKRTRARGGDLTIIDTLYGPAPWMTKQKMVRGRDMDPDMKLEIGEYIAAFAKFMRDREGFPVKFVSLHNEGTHPIRYNQDGRDGDNLLSHDYNLLWHPDQIADFISFLPDILKRNGMEDVRVTPGECTYWMFMRPVADAIAANPRAIQNIGLITSHGFQGGTDPSKDWYSPVAQDFVPINTLKRFRPDLHVWTTSGSWGNMDVNFVEFVRAHIYENQHNAFIPWAAIQRHSQWTGGDPNPGCAILVTEDGHFEVKRGYHLYKQLTRAGYAGMRVVEVNSDDPYLGLIAFAKDDTENPDSFIIMNRSWFPIDVEIVIRGTMSSEFEMHRTIADTFPKKFWTAEKPEIENYAQHPDFKLDDGVLHYTAPPLSVATFSGK